MGVRVEPEAFAVLERSLSLAGQDPATVGIHIRLTRSLAGIEETQVEFVKSPEPSAVPISEVPVRITVDPEVLEVMPNAVLTVDPQHDRIVLGASET